MNTPTTHEELADLIARHFAETPTEALILHDLPEHLYRKAEGHNVSALKPCESPKKYKWALDHPKEQTATMVFGTVVHCSILEPEKLPSLIVTRPAKWDSWRTNESKAWRDAQTALVVTEAEKAEMLACAEAVKTHPKAAWILSRAQKEVAIWKRHERTGLLLKGRLDLPFMDLEEKLAVADIKKVQSIKPALFEKAIGERLYHMQGAFYADLIGASSFYFIAVEEEAPNECDIFQLGAQSLDNGRMLYEALLDRLALCQKEDRWPGCGEDSDWIREVNAPRWAYAAETIAA